MDDRGTSAQPDTVRGRSVLLERDRHLEVLSELLDRARSGSGQLVFVSGEAGAGKTALITAFATATTGVRIVSGACDGVSTPRPLGPIHDMATALGSGVAEALLVDGPGRQRLSQLLLEDLSGNGPTLVIVEDVHWIDEATLDLLRFIGRRVSRIPVLILASYRDDQVKPFDPLQVVLGDLATLASTHHLVVPPLTRSAVAAMVGPGGVDPDHVYRLTGGNAFFVGEVLAAADGVVPPTVRDAVRGRVARLSNRGQRAMQVAAVLGTRFEPWLMAAVAGEDVTGVDEALETGLLQGGEPVLAFPHELTRIAILDDVPVIRAIGLHRLALRSLTADSSTDHARLAYHAEAAGDADAVLQHAPQAGRQAAALGAHREAVAQFRRSMRFSDRLPAADAAAILEAMSYELFLTNFLAESHAAREDAVRLRESTGDRLRQGDDLRYLSRVAWFLGRGKAAWAHAHAAVDLLEPLGRGRELAMAWGNLSHLFMLDHQAGEAIAWGQRALDLGRQLDDPEVVAYALNNIGSAELAEDLDEGREKLLESLRLAREGDLQEHVDRALINLGEAELAHRRYEAAERYLTECLDYTVACDLERCMLVVNAWRALARLEVGRWSVAEEIGRLAIDHPRLAPPGRIVALCVLARLAFRRGDGDAWDLARQAGRLAESSGDMAMLAMVASTIAEGAWLAGDHERARDAIDRAYPLAIARRDEWIVGELAAWRWRAGGRPDVPTSVAEPYRLLLGGEPDAAADAWQRLGNPYEESLARSRSTDVGEVRSAFGKLSDLGATATAQVVGRRIRELGGAIPRGPRQSTRSHPALLTDRESEVAALVADGLSNREISDRLVVSEKTVGHHVSAVLAKLGVRRRAEVARALAGDEVLSR